MKTGWFFVRGVSWRARQGVEPAEVPRCMTVTERILEGYRPRCPEGSISELRERAFSVLRRGRGFYKQAPPFPEAPSPFAPSLSLRVEFIACVNGSALKRRAPKGGSGDPLASLL